MRGLRILHVEKNSSGSVHDPGLILFVRVLVNLTRVQPKLVRDLAPDHQFAVPSSPFGLDQALDGVLIDDLHSGEWPVVDSLSRRALFAGLQLLVEADLLSVSLNFICRCDLEWDEMLRANRQAAAELVIRQFQVF